MGGVPNAVEEVADEVFFARATDVNFLLLREGRDVTLIDTGYPGDRARVEAAIHFVGAKPQTVAAILLTHAHIDHIGSVNHFAATYSTPTARTWSRPARWTLPRTSGVRACCPG
jgi:glyoxylase-like metal-dependent hydrolase (beta-lactamase superfamily II)